MRFLSHPDSPVWPRVASIQPSSVFLHRPPPLVGDVCRCGANGLIPSPQSDQLEPKAPTVSVEHSELSSSPLSHTDKHHRVSE